MFTPIPGKWSNLTSIFFKWVGSTTNQVCWWNTYCIDDSGGNLPFLPAGHGASPSPLLSNTWQVSGEPNTATHWRMFQVTWKNDKDLWIALQKFNSSPLKSYLPNRKLVFQPPCFRGYVELWWGRIRFWSRIKQEITSTIECQAYWTLNLTRFPGMLLKDMITFWWVPSLKLETSKS